MLGRPVPDALSEARKYHSEGEKGTSREAKFRSYLSAAKSYHNAAQRTKDENLKRSIAFLAQWCAQRAALFKGEGAVPSSSGPCVTGDSVAISSNRLIIEAHEVNRKRMEHMPVRSAATAVQVVRDLLQLEAALASIGLRNAAKPVLSKDVVPDQLLQSTFAFNSDLGESFMVLDAKGKPRAPVSLSLLEGRSGASMDYGPRRGGADPEPAPNRTHRGSSEAHPQLSTGAPPRDRDLERERERERARQNMRIEIENELNNPMVQSYLSTHAPSPPSRSQHFDFNNITQSAMSTFNRDTINNAEGVLNLLQTVRRIGDENAQLLLKIENLKHLEERSALVYRDIDEFKSEFTQKFETLRDMLTEYADNLAAAKRRAKQDTGGGNGENANSNGNGNGVRSSQPSATPIAGDDSESLLCSILHKELKKAKEAKAVAEGTAAKSGAAATAGLNGSKSSSGGSAPTATAGIAAEKGEWTVTQYAAKVDQLERTIKNLLRRNMQASQEKQMLEQQVKQYVEIINAHKNGGGAFDSSAAFRSVGPPGANDPVPPSGVVSTYRRPPTAAPAPAPLGSAGSAAGAAGGGSSSSSHAAGVGAGTGTAVGTAPASGAPGSLAAAMGAPGPVKRSTSGSSYRPGTKNSSAATLEVQMGAALHPPPHHPPQHPPPNHGAGLPRR